MARVATELVIEGGHRPALLQALRELWAFREVVWAFAERDTRLKYKQAALGVAWAVIQPLTFLAVFMLVFRRIAGVSGGEVAYPAFALSALVPWFFFSTALSFGGQALLRAGSLVRKVYFPREATVLGAVLSVGIDFAVGVALLLILGPVLGARLSWAVLLAVPLWLILAVLASGCALLLGALNVYYRDFRYLIPLIVQLWMLASPVAYPLSAVHKWRMLYILANPTVGVLDGFRRTFAQGQPPDLGLLMTSAAGACVAAAAGYWVFKRMEPGFADAL